MSAMEISTVKARQSADEIDWRHVWLANVMIDSGKSWPPKVDRHKAQTRKASLTRRLHKLRRIRSVLGPP
jgi:hypothetical protein